MPSGLNATADDGVGVAGERVADRRGRLVDVPQPHRAVVAAGGQRAAVGAERHRSTRRRCGRSAGGRSARPVVTSHSRTVPSRCRWPAVVPSGLNATALTASVWPVRGRRCGRPVATSHSRTVPSSLPVASSVPSGLNATDRHRVGVAGQRGADRGGRSATSHSRTVLSALPVASGVPSGLNATAAHRAGVAGERAADAAGRSVSVPQPHRAVAAAGGQGAPSGLNATEPHDVGVAGQRRADRGWPVGQRPTAAPCRPRCRWPAVRAVRAERHRDDRVGVAGQRCAELAVAGGGVPQPHRASSLPVARVVPVRAERHRRHRVGCGRSGAGRAAGARARSVRSHRITVPSALAVARVRPSGANATDDTGPVWPVSVPAYGVVVSVLEDTQLCLRVRMDAVGGQAEPQRRPGHGRGRLGLCDELPVRWRRRCCAGRCAGLRRRHPPRRRRPRAARTGR